MAGKTTHMFVDDAGNPVDLGKVNKLFKDVLRQHHGTLTDGPQPVTLFDLNDPIGQIPLAPSEESPICKKCGMWSEGCNNPFMPFYGSKNPLVTIVFDSIAPKEDKNGYMTAAGAAWILKTVIDGSASETGVTSDDCRFIALTRCAHRAKTPPNYKGKGNICKIFAVQDLMLHRPKVIMPVGSTALGLLCHKSNAQDWGGRELIWRGWPDDWLTEEAYVTPQSVQVNGESQTFTGHPLFGAPPGLEERCILFPIQAPRLIAATRNKLIEDAWARQIVEGLKLALSDKPVKTYDLPHYRLLKDVNEVIGELQWLIDHPGTLVCYDTETEGLHPFHGQKIVFMMFRFVRDGQPVAIGFPWDYAFDEKRGEASALLEHLDALRPYVEAALSTSWLIGHNLVFDILFTHCNLTNLVSAYPLDERGQIREEWREAMRRLNALAEASAYDTWHMAYTYRQQRGSLGLEILAYDYVPGLAGYEEEMTLLIELESERLHPEKGGHYARCREELWDSHFKPYVMGDVEVCYRARDALQKKLDDAPRYRIPIAHETRRGFFRYVDVPDRAWLYEKIMVPANRVLTKMMGRGMFIDQNVLRTLERDMPKAIGDAIEKMKDTENCGVVWQYCEEMRLRDPSRLDPKAGKEWQLDLESKDQLRDILFDRMNLNIQRLTKTGRKLYGEDPDHWASRIEASMVADNPDLIGTNMTKAVRDELLRYAALDKFTLNKLAVDYPEVRPLQDYRKIHKLYTTYVRPLRNIKTSLDKKQREQMQHLCLDAMIHAQFLLTGTRGGRLSSRNPNLQQLPKEGYAADGHEGALNVKEMYISRFGKRGCLYGSDFSQIELRLLAALSGDQTMVDAYFNDIDLHTLTTSRIFKLDYETFSKEHMKWLEDHGKAKEAKELKLKRDIGKTTNFLTGYGGGAFGLQTILAGKQQYHPLDFCEEIISSFFSTYPAVRELLGYYKRFIQAKEVAVSMFGRVRMFDEVASHDQEIASKALRAGCNHLIQSTASDMMLICLAVIEDMMREEGLDSILMLTVHDSLLIDAVREELPQVHEIVDTVLNNMPQVFKMVLGEDYDTSWMIVPFAGDSEIGLDYANMKGIPRDCSRLDWEKVLAHQ